MTADGSSFVDVPTAEIVQIEPDLNARPLRKQSSETLATAPAATNPALPATVPPTPASTRPADIAEAVNSASGRYRIDPDLVNSVIRAESGFKVHAVSPKGAQGLMQLMPGTASKLGVSNAFDPEANVDGGTRYLRELLERYNFDLDQGPRCLQCRAAPRGAVRRRASVSRDAEVRGQHRARFQPQEDRAAESLEFPDSQSSASSQNASRRPPLSRPHRRLPPLLQLPPSARHRRHGKLIARLCCILLRVDPYLRLIYLVLCLSDLICNTIARRSLEFMDRRRAAITGIALALLAGLVYSQFRMWKNFDWDLFLTQTRSVSTFHILTVSP